MSARSIRRRKYAGNILKLIKNQIQKAFCIQGCERKVEMSCQPAGYYLWRKRDGKLWSNCERLKAMMLAITVKTLVVGRLIEP